MKYQAYSYFSSDRKKVIKNILERNLYKNVCFYVES